MIRSEAMTRSHEPDPSRWDVWKTFIEDSRRGPAWREAGRWALEVLEEQLGGDRWLQRTWTKYKLPDPLVLSSAHTIAFAELLELAVRLELLSKNSGMGVVRRNLRRDPREQQLAHLRMQLEVGGHSVRAGYNVRFEESLVQSDRPIDVSLRGEGLAIDIEMAAILQDERSRENQDAVDSLFARIHHLEFRYGVTCEGEVRGELDEKGHEALIKEIETAAQSVEEGAEQRVVESLGARITVSRFGSATGEGGLSGPRVESQLWPRTERILRRKAEQTASSERTWLRIDLFDGMWQFTPWARMPLSRKLEVLTHAVRTALVEYPHVAGVVMTSGAAFAQGEFSEETCDYLGSVGCRRLISPLRVQESMIISFTEDASSIEPWARLYDEEPSWLD